MIADVVLADTRAYVNKNIVECHIAIDEGRIFKIGRETHMPKSDTKIELKKLLVMPGLVDVHVHLRDEGKAYKEDFYTGTAAAAAGGVTTVLDMPNNNPVTMSAEALTNRMNVAQRKILVNVGFYSEFPKETERIEDIVREGVSGFKLYTTEQIGGVDIHDDHSISEAFRTVSKLERLTATHAEDSETLSRTEDELKRSKRNDINAFLKAHSEEVEAKAVRHLLDVARGTGMHLHFCHLSTTESLQMISDEKDVQMPVTCETTPHNLLLSADDLRRIGTLALTMPPVRDKQQMDALWAGVTNGCIDIVASDHAPHTVEEKEAESVWDVKVGVPGLETALPLMLTEVKRGRLTIVDVARLMAENPVEIFKLEGKGYVEEGSDADLAVVDLSKRYKIDASQFQSKAKYSPFDGRVVQGKVVKTFVNGQLIMDHGEIVGRSGNGKIIRRD